MDWPLIDYMQAHNLAHSLPHLGPDDEGIGGGESECLGLLPTIPVRIRESCRAGEGVQTHLLDAMVYQDAVLLTSGQGEMGAGGIAVEEGPPALGLYFNLRCGTTHGD